MVYPTDTLWGVGGLATQTSAVDKVVQLKRRPGGLPISVILSSTEEVETYAELTDTMRAVLRRSLPGPYTFLLPASAYARRVLSPTVISPSGAIGVRVPDHPVALELARRAGPVTTTSANRHGSPPCRDLAGARREFRREVAVFLGGGPSPTGTPSTIVDLTGPGLRLVRGSLDPPPQARVPRSA